MLWNHGIGTNISSKEEKNINGKKYKTLLFFWNVLLEKKLILALYGLERCRCRCRFPRFRGRPVLLPTMYKAFSPWVFLATISTGGVCLADGSAFSLIRPLSNSFTLGQMFLYLWVCCVWIPETKSLWLSSYGTARFGDQHKLWRPLIALTENDPHK